GRLPRAHRPRRAGRADLSSARGNRGRDHAGCGRARASRPQSEGVSRLRPSVAPGVGNRRLSLLLGMTTTDLTPSAALPLGFTPRPFLTDLVLRWITLALWRLGYLPTILVWIIQIAIIPITMIVYVALREDKLRSKLGV